MYYSDELQFEHDLVSVLVNDKGWKNGVLKNPTEKDLINNWKDILFKINSGIDRLNNCQLTDTEMNQILEQIARLRTPLKLNGFINGTTISIKRDNPDDKLHIGKEISLKIYDKNEIAGGNSIYQIAEQPIFNTPGIYHNRRGDLMLLINGMPLIHIELKKSGVSVMEAANQIEKYASEGVYSGLFSLVQIFVAMNPEETIYFANPGSEGKFNNKFYFHWADFNNEPINDWKTIADKLLSIPMAHQMIGFYTVADDSDGVLKVMRSYQIFAVKEIFERVAKNDWDSSNQRGGYIWHTTGSGKTLTSFKSAQLIANSNDADKVVFLLDRVELGEQSYNEYSGFSDDDEKITKTNDTYDLISKLKSNDASENLIVTSIQKMSNITSVSFNPNDIAEINKKRMVVIIDECHRDTFGYMMDTIKDTFTHALFFGFTGTPIQEENKKNFSNTSDIFGMELHRYSIADGIRDKNVLGFDPTMIKIYSDQDLRNVVALEKAKATDINDVFTDESKKNIYYKYMTSVPMCSGYDKYGNFQKGIEDYIPNSQYDNDKYRERVVDNIYKNWDRLSYNKTFSALFATSSIPEAIKYYRIFKIKNNNRLNISLLVDPSLDNKEGVVFKDEGLRKIVEDYNKLFNQKFEMATYQKMKKDISLRLAHKAQYSKIKHDEQIDLLIVVDQMLTGYDSKWLNTLYLDKILDYENVIQAFSRTNRVFGKEKDFGNIRYYRKTNTMKRNIDAALKLYSGNKPFGLFVDKIKENIMNMNVIYNDIKTIFNNNNIYNFEKLPSQKEDVAKFGELFQNFNRYLNAARIQGFRWNKDIYIDSSGDITEEIADVLLETTSKNPSSKFDKINERIECDCDENTYNALLQRYNEIIRRREINEDDTPPFDIDTTVIEIDTGKIDSDYMNSKFEKFRKIINQENVDSGELEKTLNELHSSFATLSQNEQKYANIFITDVESGNIRLEPGKTFRDYLNEYLSAAKTNQIHEFCNALGYDEEKLRKIMKSIVTENNIDEFGRFTELSDTINIEKATNYFEKVDGFKSPPLKVYQKSQKLLRQFILSNGFDI